MTTATITNETPWKLPDLDTVYHCEELGPMTLGQMLDGVDPDLVPSDQTMYEDLLWASGAWDTLEQMNAAMAVRAYVTGPDGMVGLRLVKQPGVGTAEYASVGGGLWSPLSRGGISSLCRRALIV